MVIAVIGTGFVGVVTAAVYAYLGHQVWGLDTDEKKITKLKRGLVPFYEPKLKSLLAAGLESGKLNFTPKYKTAIKNADIIFICVGTPSAVDGQADLTYVYAAAKSLAPYLKDKAIITVKSTVPPRTNLRLKDIIQSKTKTNFYLASVPEFLKEGSAVKDTLEPDRIIIGAKDKFAIEKLIELHQPLPGERIIIKPESAQLAKYAANAYLAQRIVFINQIANLCEKTGADINEITQAIGHDKRIGLHYWYPGFGYGGSCFPKDVKELAAFARSIGETDSLFVKIDELNEKRIPQLLNRYAALINGWPGKTVSILGLSFKPRTDDIRQAPSLKIIPFLLKKGCRIRAYDPQAIKRLRSQFKTVYFAQDSYDAIAGSQVLIILIEWRQFKALDLNRINRLMKKPKVFIDSRNLYSPKLVQEAGLTYIGVGRS